MPVISEGIPKYDCKVTKREETEEKIKQSDSKQVNDDTVAVKAGGPDSYPMVINQTPVTSSWAEEITDKELGHWETPTEAERRRRRQERSMTPFSSIPVFSLEQQSPKIYLSRPKVLYILVSSRLSRSDATHTSGTPAEGNFRFRYLIKFQEVIEIHSPRNIPRS